VRRVLDSSLGEESEKDRVIDMVMQQAYEKDFNFDKRATKQWANLIDSDLRKCSIDELLEDLDELPSTQRKERLLAFALRPRDTMKEGHCKMLHMLLGDPIPEVRTWSVICLGRILTKKAIRPLRKRWKHEENEDVKKAMHGVLANYTIKTTVGMPKR